MKIKSLLATALLCAIPFSSAIASEGINSGDTAWIIVSTALVMMMTPAGLALFYGGLSRYKNLLNTYAMTLVAYCLASIVWVMWGYSLAFGPDKAGIIGGLENAFLAGIGVSSVSGSIPTYVFVLFQMTFAGITVALVLGSIVDRMKFSSWIVFTVLWVTLIYAPIAHWVWGGGWMGNLGALDFAGGNVVHINAGVAGLVLSRMVGKRIGYGKEAMFPSSIALTALGAALLWLAGSALMPAVNWPPTAWPDRPFWSPTHQLPWAPWPGCSSSGKSIKNRPFWVWLPGSCPGWWPLRRRRGSSTCRHR
jgi:Amt family ammonium transporter